jgi:putative thiamine transport system ATP-binding protein
MNDTGLELRDVSLRLDDRILISSLSLTVRGGDVVTLMGQSGCGKSSLLAWMCGTLSPAFTASGNLAMDGEELTRTRPELRRLGILFQDDLLFPHLSVGQNLLFALPSSIRNREARLRRIESALAEADLGGFSNRDPATLSGGQRARVSLMRVLLSEPRALLLDEPFSKLDPTTRQKFREFVFDHARKRRLPTLMVTHDPNDASASGGRVIEL